MSERSAAQRSAARSESSEPGATHQPSQASAARAAPGKHHQLAASSASPAAAAREPSEARGRSTAGPTKLPDWQMDLALLAAMGLDEPAAGDAGAAPGDAPAKSASSSTAAPAPSPSPGPAVQRKREGAAALDGAAATDLAARGVSGAASELPHAAAIQRSFGHHDIGGIQAHTDGSAASASRALGAEAYATGHHIAFGGAPSLHTAAHEAAHVVQQRSGVQLKSGLGEAGDAHEHHADAVAERVVRGESAQGLLDQYTGGRASAPAPAPTAAAPVQRMVLDEETHVARSDSGKMAVVGHRQQNLYATADLIKASNEAMERAKARIRFAQGAEWEGADGLYKVTPEVIEIRDAGKNVSDQIIHPVLGALEPVKGESVEEREKKTKKYRAFWKGQQDRMFQLSIAISKFQNKKYVDRNKEFPPRSTPGFSPKELRDFVTEETKRLSGDGYRGTFFATVVLRSLLEDYDAHVGKLRDAAVSEEKIAEHVLRNRVKGRAHAEEIGFAEEEDFYTDLIAHPATEMELPSARESAYQELFERGELRDDCIDAANFLRDKIYATIDLMDGEIESDGDTMIGPKRCSDMTRFIYGGADLKDLPLNQAGGRVHHDETVEGLGRIFHSAGVVMEDGDDLITLEAADGSGALPVGRTTWWFQMYGKKGEMSFAEQTKKRWNSIV